MFAAQVWHWWIGVFLLIGSIGAVAAVFAGYAAKVSATRYPNRRQRQALKQK
jgi:formate-dependent nitrite reductase membrane component NrfD